MTLKTTIEQLEEVQAAISNILTTGQHIEASFGRKLTMADLDTLTKREEMLLER